MTATPGVSPDLIWNHPDIAALPVVCREALAEVIAQAATLSTETTWWIERIWEQRNTALWISALTSERRPAASALNAASWPGFDGLVAQAAVAAARGCATLNLASDAAATLLHAWREGHVLGAWEASAPAGAVEIARTFLAGWTESATALIELAEAAQARAC